jgi:hypothetical protein
VRAQVPLVVVSLLSLSPAGCVIQDFPDTPHPRGVACTEPYRCTGAEAPTFVELRPYPFHVEGGDFGTWHFERDNQVCELSVKAITCFVRGQEDDGSVPLFVSANIADTGIERRFVLDLTGHPNAHVRVYRDHQIVDDFDSAPTYKTDAACPDFRSDLTTIRSPKID